MQAGCRQAGGGNFPLEEGGMAIGGSPTNPVAAAATGGLRLPLWEGKDTSCYNNGEYTAVCQVPVPIGAACLGLL